MKNQNKKIETSRPKIDATKIVIYTDGSGARPDGTGSGHVWFRVDTNEHKIVPGDHLTNNQAEYKAILSALEAVPKKAAIEIRTDSQIICYQLKGQYRAKDPQLAKLRDLIRELILKNNLTVSFVWVPRKENRAGMMI
jgi:ribonuclease HI